MAASDAVNAGLRYFKRFESAADALPVLRGGESRQQLTEKVTMPVHNARAWAASLGAISLDVNGVELVRHISKVRDFEDDQEIERTYYPEITEQVKRITGAKYAFCWNHVVRTENPKNYTLAYARLAHIDVSPWLGSGEHVSDDAAIVAALRARLVRNGVPASEAASLEVVVLNTWQPWSRPVERTPLALLDASTVDLRRDTQPYLYSAEGTDGSLQQYAYDGHNVDWGSGETLQFAAVHSAEHRWLYWPGMALDEMLIFKQFDPRPGQARCTFHTAFDDPTSPTNAAARRSIEVRLVCLCEPVVSTERSSRL